MVQFAEPVVRGVVQRYAQLLAKLGDEIGQRPLVLPTAEFFPDRFQGDVKSLRRLIQRMQKHAGMSDIPIEASLVEPPRFVKLGNRKRPNVVLRPGRRCSCSLGWARILFRRCRLRPPFCANFF